jgi:hypothetical protein
MPISVKNNPWGPLWNKDLADGTITPPLPPANPYVSSSSLAGMDLLAAEFQDEVIVQITPTRLGNPNINGFSYEVAPNKNAAESQSQNPTIDHYPNQVNAAINPTFQNTLAAAAALVGLSTSQVINRATALSCAGCHQPAAFGLTNPDAIGPGQSWPSSLGFVHVGTSLQSLQNTTNFQPAYHGGNNQGFVISPALENMFLPARKAVLTDLVNADVCNCVPDLGPVVAVPNFPQALVPLPKIPPISEKQRNAIKRFETALTEETRDLLAKVEKEALYGEKKIGHLDLQALFEKQKSILHEAEYHLEEQLKKMGLQPIVPPLKPQPVRLPDSSRLTSKLKAEVLNELLKYQPPRRTITGSFRTH